MDIGFDKDKAVIGMRQVLRLLNKNQLQVVYVAGDADFFVREKVISACEKAQVPYIDGLTKEEMGKIAGIEVFAACFGILK
ncbi:MAG: ribosomal L7Ae/L30e/S12e/Gadd45 family protein [Lachnospiraceae bacterium]|nr:ribosomal L7Ae/L30e/S12e/Gadd45 family protein [Lachnospiraceae bacterium]